MSRLFLAAVSVDPKKTVDITTGDSAKVTFSYSVKWRPTDIEFGDRMDRYSRYSFLPQHLEVGVGGAAAPSPQGSMPGLHFPPVGWVYWPASLGRLAEPPRAPNKTHTQHAGTLPPGSATICTPPAEASTISLRPSPPPPRVCARARRSTGSASSTAA